MSQTAECTVRVLDQEIDAVVPCPGHADHIVVATYSLIKDDSTTETKNGDVSEEDNERSAAAPRRIGSLQILPMDIDTSHLSAETTLHRARRDFPCAILDIRFHPRIADLLGAATSTGEVRFFDVVWAPGESHSDDGVRLVPLGYVQVSGEETLVTQFAWIDLLEAPPSEESEGGVGGTVHLVTSDTTGQVKLVRVNIPLAPHSSNIEQDMSGDLVLPCEVVDVHQHLHGLEAWTTTSILLPDSAGGSKQLVLSGGDDSCLIASSLNVDTASADSEQVLVDPPLRIHLDKRTHAAGVVCILPLGPSVGEVVPVLTGSYDQRLRLIVFNTTTNSFTVTSELELGGGVWRVGMLSTYATGDEDGDQSRDWILLVSAMHAGCYVVRLSLTAKDGALVWTWNIETMFREPHESMVYASAAIEDRQRTGRWTVVSTSFYDKRVCVWRWTDPKKSL